MKPINVFKKVNEAKLAFFIFYRLKRSVGGAFGFRHLASFVVVC